MTLRLPYATSSIQGWTLPNELRFLYDESCRLEDEGVPGRLLEIGCWLGRSTYALALSGEVDVVDTFCGSYEITPADRVENQLLTFATNMTNLGVGSRVHAYQGMSADWLERLPGPYRLIFIDGGHDYPTVHNDLQQSLRLLSPGGTLVLDDVISEFPGVQRAVRDILDNQIEEVGKMGVWRCPRARDTGSPPKRTGWPATSLTVRSHGE